MSHSSSPQRIGPGLYYVRATCRATARLCDGVCGAVDARREGGGRGGESFRCSDAVEGPAPRSAGEVGFAFFAASAHSGTSLVQVQTHAEEEERKDLSVFSSGGVQFLGLAVSMCLVM